MVDSVWVVTYVIRVSLIGSSSSLFNPTFHSPDSRVSSASLCPAQVRFSSPCLALPPPPSPPAVSPPLSPCVSRLCVRLFQPSSLAVCMYSPVECCIPWSWCAGFEKPNVRFSYFSRLILLLISGDSCMLWGIGVGCVLHSCLRPRIYCPGSCDLIFPFKLEESLGWFIRLGFC